MEGSTSKCKDGQKMVLEHEHPLELVDLQQKRQHSEETDDDDIELDTIPEFRGQCCRCSQVISEYHMYYYKCVDTCDYSLHKFYAELPTKLEHTAHVHPLVICQYKQLWWMTYCNVCKSRHKPEEIAYACGDCSFNVDVNCVLGLEEKKIYHPSHPHQLVSTFSKPILCACDACGKEHKGIFYRCTIRCFAIHSDCAFLPRNLQIQKTTYDEFHHTHPLVLSYSFPKADQDARYYPKFRVCGLDFWEKDHLWFYKCEKCWYYSHLNYATSKTEPFMSILSSS
nr:hypothetical protein [Tanacetum cinerariifolium]